MLHSLRLALEELTELDFTGVIFCLRSVKYKCVLCVRRENQYLSPNQNSGFLVSSSPFRPRLSFYSYGKKRSSSGCHLVKYHIGKGTLRPKELKPDGFKLGDRKRSAESFWQMETSSSTPDVFVFGVVSGKLKCL